MILSGLIGVFGAFAFQYLGYAGGFLVFLTLYVAGESFFEFLNGVVFQLGFGMAAAVSVFIAEGRSFYVSIVCRFIGYFHFEARGFEYVRSGIDRCAGAHGYRYGIACAGVDGHSPVTVRNVISEEKIPSSNL